MSQLKTLRRATDKTDMKFNEDTENGLYLLKAYGDGWVQINDRQLSSGFILGQSVLIETGLPATFNELQTLHLNMLFKQHAEIILIGTGKTQKLPTPEVHQALIQNKRGFELMTTAAACRTYRVLNAEARSVLALLFPA